MWNKCVLTKSKDIFFDGKIITAELMYFNKTSYFRKSRLELYFKCNYLGICIKVPLFLNFKRARYDARCRNYRSHISVYNYCGSDMTKNVVHVIT